ncbi:tumor necrosis factor receptor superfamily member 12A [Pelodytes ibericus]
MESLEKAPCFGAKRVGVWDTPGRRTVVHRAVKLQGSGKLPQVCEVGSNLFPDCTLLTQDKATFRGLSCPPRQSWSSDLDRCMECSLCETSGKSDFCQTCESSFKERDFPWLLVGGLSALGFTLLCVIVIVTVLLTRCRRKNKFTTPIEETGAHSAEELLIH